MPNMFGGDQHHPAYNSRTKLGENQVLVGDDLYEIEISSKGVATIKFQNISDTGWTPTVESFVPEEVKEKIKKLQQK